MKTYMNQRAVEANGGGSEKDPSQSLSTEHNEAALVLVLKVNVLERLNVVLRWAMMSD